MNTTNTDKIAFMSSAANPDFIKKCKRDLYRTAKLNGRYVAICYAGAQLDGEVKFYITSSSGASLGLVHHSKLTDYCL